MNLRISRLLLVSTLSLAIMFSSVIPVAAAEKDLSASLDGNPAGVLLELDPTYSFYGYASCRSSESLLGTICYWLARLGGSHPEHGTNAAASFGHDDSFTNIMDKSDMIIGDHKVVEYERSSNMFTYYKKANTRLYY